MGRRAARRTCRHFRPRLVGGPPARVDGVVRRSLPRPGTVEAVVAVVDTGGVVVVDVGGDVRVVAVTGRERTVATVVLTVDAGRATTTGVATAAPGPSVGGVRPPTPVDPVKGNVARGTHGAPTTAATAMPR